MNNLTVSELEKYLQHEFLPIAQEEIDKILGMANALKETGNLYKEIFERQNYREYDYKVILNALDENEYIDYLKYQKKDILKN